MKLEITLTDGRWLINGKRYEDLSEFEAKSLNDFFIDVKNNEGNGAY